PALFPYTTLFRSVFVGCFHPQEMLRGIEEAADANRGVDQKAAQLHAGAFELGLKEIVHESRDEPDIVEEVGDPALQRIGHHPLIASCDRFEYILVKLAIELEDS